MSQTKIFSINDLSCDHVKIYLNAVEVKKSIKFESGFETKVTIGDLCHLIDPNSIKIICNAKISDVTVQKVPVDPSILKELEDKLFTETIKLNNLSKQIKLLNNFAISLADQTDSDKFYAFIDSFYEKEAFLVKEKKNCEDIIKNLEQNLEEKRTFSSFEVNFLVDTGQNDSSVNLEIIYQNYGTYWRPRYDFNFNLKTKTLSVDINGLVENKVKEEWKDIEATFWLCDINSKCEPKMVRFKTLQSKSAQQMLDDMKFHIIQKSKNLSLNENQSRPNFASAIFPEKKINLNTGFNKFFITNINLDPEFRTEATSTNSNFQLKAKIKNTAGFVFLEGDVSIYLNENFMRNIRIKNWCMLEEIEIFVGNDDLAKIFCSPLTVSKTKMTDKKFFHVIEQKFFVENTSDHSKELFVIDFFPISTDEKISVKLLEPSGRQSSNVKLVKQGCLEFCFNLESGQKIESCTRYSVEFPFDKFVELF